MLSRILSAAIMAAAALPDLSGAWRLHLGWLFSDHVGGETLRLRGTEAGYGVVWLRRGRLYSKTIYDANGRQIGRLSGDVERIVMRSAQSKTARDLPASSALLERVELALVTNAPDDLAALDPTLKRTDDTQGISYVGNVITVHFARPNELCSGVFVKVGDKIASFVPIVEKRIAPNMSYYSQWRRDDGSIIDVQVLDFAARIHDDELT